MLCICSVHACTYTYATINSLKTTWRGREVEGDIALRSKVSSTMILMLGSIPGLGRFFFSSHPTIFYRSTISDRLRFALRAHGLRRLLRRANYIYAPFA